MKLKTLIIFFSLTLFFESLSYAESVKSNLSKEKESTPIEYVYDKKNNLKVYAFFPSDFDKEKNNPAVVIFHGGGWSMGEASWGFSTAQHFASKGMIALSAQYRLQNDKGNSPYESALDAQKVIRWMRINAKTLFIDKKRIAAYGWSAGAHLAASAAIFNNLDKPEASVSSAPNLLALKSPAVSLLSYPNFQRRLGNKIKVAELSPAEKINKETPPTIIVIGKNDTVTPIAGSQLYHDSMLKYQNDSELHIYDGVGHLFTPSTEPDDGWPNPDERISKKAWQAIDAFFTKHGYYHQ